MSHIYKNIIFTNHAFDRINQRSVSMEAIHETIKNPDKKTPDKSNSQKFIKTIRNRKYHVVATFKPDQKKYLVISAWVRGEDDRIPLAWMIISLPFKLLLWVIRLLLKIIWQLLKKLWR